MVFSQSYAVFLFYVSSYRFYDATEARVVSRFWALEQTHQDENPNAEPVSVNETIYPQEGTSNDTLENITATVASAEHIFNCVEN